MPASCRTPIATGRTSTSSPDAPSFRTTPRFTRLPERVKHIRVLYQIVEEEAMKRSTAAWVAFCDRVSIPCMPVLELSDLPEDPHLKQVGLFQTAEHPTEGRYRLLQSPVSFSAVPFRVRRHAPGSASTPGRCWRRSVSPKPRSSSSPLCPKAEPRRTRWTRRKATLIASMNEARRRSAERVESRSPSLASEGRGGGLGEGVVRRGVSDLGRGLSMSLPNNTCLSSVSTVFSVVQQG